MKSGSQSDSGKSLEYAVALALEKLGARPRQTDKPLQLAEQAYSMLTEQAQQELLDAALTGVKHIQSLEHANMSQGRQLAYYLQPDAKGQAGDVRDIVVQNISASWTIGISAKHRHDAVKHSRLSELIDFGEKWNLGFPCSAGYKQCIKPIFAKLRAWQAEGKLWREIPNKKSEIYRPVLYCFINEVTRLCAVGEAATCKNLLLYLLGNEDFYKLMVQRDSIVIQAFNLQKTLAYGKLHPPEKIVYAGFLNDSDSTAILIFDYGWQFSLRLHNAESQVKPSLKFDIRLTGIPPELYTNHHLR